MAQTSSLQEFGKNRFNLRHSRLDSFNYGYAYPIDWQRIRIGDTLHNDIDVFIRSSALVDPSFLDSDISVGHYFVPYNDIDPLYESRMRKFKGLTTDQEFPSVTWSKGSLYANESIAGLTNCFAASSLMDRLGFSLSQKQTAPVNGVLKHDLSPLLAYHLIVDKFFTNTHVQDNQYTHEWILKNIVPAAYSPALDCTLLLDKQESHEVPVWDPAGTKNFYALRPINYLPDYFTSSRPSRTGPTVAVPTTTIPNLLDAMLMQKVADMLNKGGFSYDDYIRVLFNEEVVNAESREPIFLGGSTGPIQVSTVVNTASDLGAQGGTIAGSAGHSNGFTHTFTAEGIYMALLFIRPRTYYTHSIRTEFREFSAARRVIPQLADTQNAPIYKSEITGLLPDAIGDFATSNVSGPVTGVFGFKDRYEEYRTRYNTVHSDMRTLRTGWYIGRDYRIPYIGQEFLSIPGQLKYTPWVVQDETEDHFFARCSMDMELTTLLPAVSRPYVW